MAGYRLLEPMVHQEAWLTTSTLCLAVKINVSGILSVKGMTSMVIVT